MLLSDTTLERRNLGNYVKVASRDVWEKYSQNSLWADIPMEEPIAIPQNYRLIKEVSKYYFCKIIFQMESNII